jgi:DNA-binding CsgD family transcriptional regulator
VELLRPCFARTEPWLQAGKYAAALMSEGMSNRDIAQQLVISKRTVDAHLEHIFGKLGISSRVQLATGLSPTAPSPERPPPPPAPPGP